MRGEKNHKLQDSFFKPCLCGNVQLKWNSHLFTTNLAWPILSNLFMFLFLPLFFKGPQLLAEVQALDDDDGGKKI